MERKILYFEHKNQPNYMRVELSTYYRYYLQAHLAVSEIYSLGFKSQQLFGHKNVDIKKLIEVKRKFNLNFSMHSPFLNPHAPDTDWLMENSKKYKKSIIKDLHVASLLGVNFLVIHGGIVEKESDYKVLIGNIREVCDYANARGIKICIENSHTFFPRLANEMLKIYRDVNKINLKFAFDISHAMVVLKNESKILEFFEKIKGNILNLHLSDMNPTVDSHNIPDLSKPFFKILFSKIKEMDIDALTLEIRPEAESREIKRCLKYIGYLLSSKLRKKYSV